MSFNQVSMVYWLNAYLDSEWTDISLIEKLEQRFIALLKIELDIQKQIENDTEVTNIPEGLQTMNVKDVETIENFYNKSEQL